MRSIFRPEREHSLADICRLIIILRLVGAGIGLSAVTLIGFGVRDSLPIAGLLLVIFPLSVVWWLLLRLGVNPGSLILAQLVGDLIVESGIVYFTGGASSYFAALYLITIFVAGVFLASRSTYILATLATLLFAFVASIQYGNESIAVKKAMAFPVLHIVFQTALFYLAALISNHSSHCIRQIAERLDLANLELARTQSDVGLIIQSINSGLVTVTSDGIIEEYNDAAEKILKFPASEVKGRFYRDIFDQISPELSNLLSLALESGRQEKRGEVTARTRDGNYIPLGVSISLLSSQGGQRAGVVAIFQDLTDAKRMAERVRQADRLAALGELAAAIAHEIRTPLASICGSIEMLRDSLEPKGEDRKLVELVIKESERLRKKIDYFLEFARSRPTRFEEARIDRLLREVLCLVRNHPSFSEGIEVEIRGSEEVVASVDEETIKQVFYNLAINAVEAIGGNGKLVITLEPSTEIEGRAFACIRFEDNGAGIDQDDLKRVFEPFFTRKESGTGLGLAIASRIVEDHGGWIDIKSAKGKGTVVSVYLPVDRSETGARAERLVEPANVKVE